MSENKNNPWKIAFITATCTALLTYVVPRLGDFIVPREKETINIGAVNDTIHFTTITKNDKPKIIYKGDQFTLNGKSLSAQELVKKYNNEIYRSQVIEDSLKSFKNLAIKYHKLYKENIDSVFIYRSIKNLIKKDFGINYSVKQKDKETYTFSRNNNKKIDSALVLLELYGNRLRVDENNNWFVITDREYRRELRKK